jgi:hypothetical protein
MDNLTTVADAGTVDAREAQGLSPETLRGKALDLGPRRIVLRTSGRRHGPIARLVSPSDVGELIKPFVAASRPCGSSEGR